MFETLIDRVKANIDEKNVQNDVIVVRGWSFSEEHGVCPIRCKYDATIRSVDIELRKDISDLFKRPNIILSGWKITLPFHKYIDFQIKLGNEWSTFLSYHSSPVPQFTIDKPTPKNEIVIPQSSPSTVSFDSNVSSLSNIFIIDQFYQYPDTIRNFGLDTLQNPHLINTIKNNHSLKEKFEKILNKRIVSFSQYADNGTFSLSNRSSSISYELKPQQYTGIVFLTPNAPLTSGITLYRVRSTGNYTLSDTELATINNTKNTTELEAVDIVGNVYNRLVLFNSQMIHSITHHFGSEKETSRLVQLFSFDLV